MDGNADYGFICTGHVERTNDRDYEIEERYVRCCLAAFSRFGIERGLGY